MTATVTNINSAPTTPLEFAIAYAKLGWHIFPCFWIKDDGLCACGNPSCKSPGKHPIGFLAKRGQDDATTDEPTIRRWWTNSPTANIAIMLAPSGLIAVDIDPRNGGWDSIDDLEAKHGPLTSDVLQLTGGGGEHRVFSLDADSSASLPGKLGRGIDLKRNGYIIASPSNHASGARYEWEGSSDPLEGCIPSPLPDWLRGSFASTAAPVQAASSIQPLSDQDKADLTEALSFIPADERSVWVDMGMALHSTNAGNEAFFIWDTWSATSSKYDPIDQMRIWRSFRIKGLSGLTKASVYKTAQDAGWVNAGPSIPIEVDPVAIASPIVSMTVKPGKSDLMTIPVKPLQEIAQWMSGLTETYHPAISVAGALALGSVITGRLYRSEYANWTAMLYVVSGPSGVGKNYIQVGAERILLRAGLDHMIAGDFYTHQSALYSMLRRAPAHLCISDEFGENFYEARKNNNSNKMTVFKALKKVYSGADHIFKAESYATLAKDNGDDRAPIFNPSVTMVGLTTPLQFYSEIKTSHIEGGLMNRLVIINADSADVKPRTNQSDEPPDYIIDWLNAVHRTNEPLMHVGFGMEPNRQEVTFANEAKALFDDFKQTQNDASKRLDKIALGAMPMRWRENAMRIATMLAACERPSAPVVLATHAQWAIDYVQFNGESAVHALSAQTGENDYQQQMNVVNAFIREAGEDGRSATELSRAFRSIKRRDMAEIKNHLVESALVSEVVTKTTGASITRWVAVGLKNDD